MRYQKYNHLTKSFQLSKSQVNNPSNLISLQKLDVKAGHFKPTSTFVEHGLLVTNITGQIPQTNLYKHGKRLRNTVMVTTSIRANWKWAVLDKFLSTFLPAISDLRPYSEKKTKSTEYSWRIRNFFEWTESDTLLSERIMKKDVFLPLFFNVTLTHANSQKLKEDSLRMLRIPANLHKN